MYSKLVFLFFAVGVALAITQKDSLKRKERGLGIFNGKSTKIKNHNYVAGIVYNGSYVCAGTIVDQQWVVTTAECLQGIYTTFQLTVVVGSSDGVTGTTYNVTQVVPHPNFTNASNLDYNYACVQVDGSFTFSSTVGKVELPSAEPATGAALTVAGYGDTSSIESEASGNMLQGTMKWVAKTDCESTYSAYLNWTERMACASSPTKVTLCNGDYGDAFVKKVKKNNVFYAMFAGGIASGFCSGSAQPILLADVYPVTSWIQEITGSTIAEN